MEGENPNYQNKDTKVLLYVDNSNFFENAKRFSQREKKYKVIDGSIRLKYFDLINSALNGRELIKAEFYGSGPEETNKVWENVWEKFTREKVRVHWFDRSKLTGNEKEVDQSLTADAVEQIVKGSTSDGEKPVVILFSGDRDFLPTARKALKYGYSVEIWGFNYNNSIGKAVKKFALESNGKVAIKYVDDDDIFKNVTFQALKYDKERIPNQSIVATIKIPNEKNKEEFLNEFVLGARKAFQLPLMGKYYEDQCEHIVLVLCAHEIYTRPKCYTCGQLKIENQSYDLQKDVEPADYQKMYQLFPKYCQKLQLWRHFKLSREPLKSPSLNFESESRFQKLPLENDKKGIVLKKSEDKTEGTASTIITLPMTLDADSVTNFIEGENFKLEKGRIAKPWREQCYYSFWCPYLDCNFRHTKNEKEYFNKLNKKFGNKNSDILKSRYNYKKNPCDFSAASKCSYAGSRSFMCGFHHNYEESACTTHLEKGNCKHSRGSIKCQEESSLMIHQAIDNLKKEGF